ncbi:MAG: PH domain-containing protein [Weeksellaceae bacterium]|jgi:hypothetical protein|nr:PH domain-containing protein [Weeksellaceae bacterium]MDX9704581.1 PH domain-containing protein [Weeksellaceae bacterium]
MKKTYRSKVSYLLLLFIFLLFYLPLIVEATETGFHRNLVFSFSLLFVIYALVLHLFFFTIYTIEDNQLKIKCGFFTYKPIPISAIKSISKTRSILASPAASFDRIEIKYGKWDEIILSPQNKYEFAKDLCAINPEIQNLMK